MDNLFTMERLRAWLLAVLPWAVGIMIFVNVCNHFFAPQFDNKTLSQGDIVQYEGMSRDVKEHREATGEDPQWTGAMFSGMPAYLIDMEYPTQDVKQTVGNVVKVVDGPMNMILFAMLFMMLAVVLMGVNPWIGIIAGLAYGLSTYFLLIIDAGHITKMWALVYAPPMVGAVWYALRRNMWVGAVLAALFGSLELAANHPQITYYFLFACLALWVSEFVVSIKDKVLKPFGYRTALLALAALLAGGSNFAPLWYAKSHQKHTVRGVSDESKSAEEARQEKIAWNTAWSYGKAESFNMLVPNYMGSATNQDCIIEKNYDILETLAHEYAEERVEGRIEDMIIEETIAIMHSEMRKTDPNVTLDDIWTLIDSDKSFEEYFYDLSDYLYNQYHEELFYDCYEALFHEYYNKLNPEAHKACSTYWGEQPGTAGPTYLGAVVVFLAILGIFLAAQRNRWWLVAVSIFAILLAWGKNIMGFYELMFDWLPAYSDFRTVSMALVVVEWSVVVLAAYALMSLWRDELTTRKMVSYILASVGVVLMLIIIMAMVADYGVPAIESLGDMWWVDELKHNAEEARSDMFRSDAWRTIGYVVGAAAILLLYAMYKYRDFGVVLINKALPYVMLTLVGLLLTLDLVGVGDRYLNDKKWHERSAVTIAPSAADKAILKDKELGFRVFDLNCKETAYASYFHRSVDGYHGAKLSRYDEVLSRYIYGMYDEYVSKQKLSPENINILAMLNVKYCIVGNSHISLSSGLGVAPMGAAWFVEGGKRVDTPKEAFTAIGTVDLSKYAVVEPSAPQLKEKYSTAGSIALVEYAPNYLRYEYDSPAEALALFSEIYYPDGWTAYIDGVEADYFTADYILRAMELPAGKHTVEWKFRAPNWGVASAITGISSWLILIALLLLLTAPLSKRYVVPHIVSWYNSKRSKK